MTAKQDIFAHLTDTGMHGVDLDYRSWTYESMRRIHYQMHHGLYLDHVANHYHIGRNLDPVEQPEGWNDGGSRYTAVES
jgi:hypothetical protein